MKILLLCLFLISCGGGGGSVPDKPEPYGRVDFAGSWQLSINIPECDKKFMSLYYIDVNVDSFDLLTTMTSMGEYPDVNNMAACNSKIIPDIVDLAPYKSLSTATQFREFLSLRLMWDYEGIDISKYSNSQITINRTIQTKVGERIWNYEFNRIKSPYSVRQIYDTTLINQGLVAVKDCSETYTTTFSFKDVADPSLTFLDKPRYNGRFLEFLLISNKDPLFVNTGPCGLPDQTAAILLPTYYPAKMTALGFRNLMQGVWGMQTTILSWWPDEIRIVRLLDSNVAAGYQFTVK